MVVSEELELALAVEPGVHRPDAVVVRSREPVAERHVAVGGHAHQPQARAARERLADALVDLLDRVLDVREPVVPVVDRELEELLRQLLELAQHAVEPGVFDRVAPAVGGCDGSEADLPESDLVAQVVKNARHVQRLPGERHPGPDRAGAVALQQAPDLRHRVVVAAHPVLEDAELVLHLLGPVDADGHADPVLGQPVDHLVAQQRAVGGQREIDVLPQLPGALARVGHRLLEDLEVEQRLATEEGEVRDRQIARLLEHEVDALPRGLLAHVGGRGVARGVDDLVLAVLVAVRARQVALVRDVEDHRGERKIRLGQHPREGLFRGRGEADRLHPHQLRQAPPHGGLAETWGERGHQRVLAGCAGVEGLQHGERGLVEVEDRGRRHQVEEGLAPRLEGMELALGEEDGVGGRGAVADGPRRGGGGPGAHRSFPMSEVLLGPPGISCTRHGSHRM